MVNKYVFETVQKYNGSISAEHGVGMTKSLILITPVLMKKLIIYAPSKQVFDPNGIMNRGKIFD